MGTGRKCGSRQCFLRGEIKLYGGNDPVERKVLMMEEQEGNYCQSEVPEQKRRDRWGPGHKVGTGFRSMHRQFLYINERESRGLSLDLKRWVDVILGGCGNSILINSGFFVLFFSRQHVKQIHQQKLRIKNIALQFNLVPVRIDSSHKQTTISVQTS